MTILSLGSPDEFLELYELATPEERRLLERALLEQDPLVWAKWILPTVVSNGFADHHEALWAWVWAIEPDTRPEPFVGVWARGGAKSSSAEAACIALGARQCRRYALYVCATQEQADDHVGNIAALLERPEVAAWYPEMGERLVGKFGNAKGWRRNRVRTATGFTVDAIGLDTASRGAKLDEQRPDLIVIDDVDHHDDSPKMVKKKIDLLTKALIPAGSADVAVLAIQNLVHRDGIFARLVDGRATFLARRHVSGPIPAVRGLVTEHRDTAGVGRDVIVAGEPTWVGQPLATCQEQIDDWGLSAFLAEAQHAVARHEGALWVPEQLAVARRSPVPDQSVIAVAIDPSGGDGPDNDEQGIVIVGRDHHGHGWVLEDATVRLSPAGWGDEAVRAFDEFDADHFVAEANYGGDMVVDVLKSAVERRWQCTVTDVASDAKPWGRLFTLRSPGRAPVLVHVVHASRGKRVRAEPVAALYGRPGEEATWSTSRVHHAGHFVELEDEMTSWSPEAAWSPNRVDAMVWGLTDLLIDTVARRRRRSIVDVGAAA